MGMVGEACSPSNAYYPRTPDYTLCSGVHVCWSEHSDSSFVYGFMILNYGFGTMTATTLWFILRGDLLYVFPCVILFLCFSVLLVLRLPRLGKRELILVLSTFVRFVLVWICRFPLPLGVWEGLRFVFVALPGIFSYLFFFQCKLLVPPFNMW